VTAPVSLVKDISGYAELEVKRALRQALDALGSSPESLIPVGGQVCLKPNWIAGQREGDVNEWQQIITHSSVLEVVLNWVCEHLQGGRIIIADAPQTDSDFRLLSRRMNLDSLLQRTKSRWPGVTVSVIDLRQEWWVQEGGVTIRREQLPGDPLGATLINLEDNSEFATYRGNGTFYGADYDFPGTSRHHSRGRHCYLLSRSVLESDLFINLPKLKTHKKAGVTISLKNLVGVNADKNYLPHYSWGTPTKGGDERPEGGAKNLLESLLSRAFKRAITKAGGKAPAWGPIARNLGVKVFGNSSSVLRSGNWWGNDTLWRMCLDLNKILLWYNGDGSPRETPRPYLSIVDGIIAGQGDGPVDADAFDLGVLVAGTDPVAVDLVCAQAIGLDWRKIPIIRQALSASPLPITGVDPNELRIRTVGRESAEIVGLDNLRPLAHFRPHFGWAGHIELDEISHS
jgi:uncharacterized protein (DUF362 family)